MDDECGSRCVSDRAISIPRSETRLVVGEKRNGTEIGEKPEVGRKLVKVRDLDSVLRSEGIDTHHPKSSENKEVKDHFLSAEKENSQATVGTVTINSDIAQSRKIGRDTLPLQINSNPTATDPNTKVSAAYKLPSSEKHSTGQDGSFVPSRGFGWKYSTEDVSSSLNQNSFYPYKNLDKMRESAASECGSTSDPFEEKGAMRVWREMKQNGFLSSSHGGIPMPMPKPRGRKSKNDGMKKKIELAKREQIDRFAKIAAPSGLLNDLNPGIINHVRNSKQVHSIIEALVKSEKLANRHTKKKDLENLNCISHEDGYLNTSSMSESAYLNSESPGGDGDSGIIERRVFGKTIGPSYSNPEAEDDLLALKLSSSATVASENTSSFSNELSMDLTIVSSLSVKAANIASQWLELLHQDIEERLAALRRSKKRVRTVIYTELPSLMRREFSSNQENDPFVMENSSACSSDNASGNAHQARWSALFDQMDTTLSGEEKQLESWSNQVKEMQLHCERGLQLFQYNATHGFQVSGTLKKDSRLEKADNLERECDVRAAAASIHSTCNFLLSKKNQPCF